MPVIEVVAAFALLINIMIEGYMFFYTSFEKKMQSLRVARKSAENSAQTGGMLDQDVPRKCLIYNIYHEFERFSYGLMRYRVIRIGKIPSFYVRNFFYRRIYHMDITRRTHIHGGCEFRSPWNIHADHCVIGPNCILDGRRGITLGQEVVLGSNVHIWTEEHSVDDPYFRVLPQNAEPVIIEDHAWLCSDTTILPGVRINRGVVVAARACITKNTQPFGVYAGIPARLLRERTQNLVYTLPEKPGWKFF